MTASHKWAHGPGATLTVEEYRALAGGGKARIRTADKARRYSETHGILFDSRLEMTVYQRTLSVLRPGQRLSYHARLPLVALFPMAGPVKRCCYYESDLVIWEIRGLDECWRPVLIIECKPAAREARNDAWSRTAAAIVATYGNILEVVTE